MPTREEMIAELKSMQVAQSSIPSKMGLGERPSREQMIAELKAMQASQHKPDTVVQNLVEGPTTSLRSAMETVTLGASEPINSGVNALAETARRAIFEDDKPENEFSIDNLKQRYQDDVAARNALKEKYQAGHIMGSIAGAFAPTGPGNAIAKGVTNTGSKIAELVASKTPKMLAENALLKGGGAIAKGGAEAATTALLSEGVRQNTLKEAGFQDDTNIIDTAKTSAQWGAGLSALPQAFKAAKYLGKRGMSITLGPRVKTIDAYLENAERIRKAPTVGEIKDEIDNIVVSLADDVAQQKLTDRKSVV